ncbi:MAG: dihydrodipicolinate reductase [Rhodobacteraceae bacterium]|nr:dihydrodipicolinate reductase [Paracoccaceae bacterium]
MNRFALVLVIASAILPLRASADGFIPVTEKSRFMALVEGRELRLGLFRISLSVRPDGRIEGSALGWDVTGRWHWKDGYFCRELDWSGTPIPYNCQLVEAKGDRELRFTVDRGMGDSASFRLR